MPSPEPDTTGGGTGILVEEDVRLVPTEEGDHDRFAHYAPRDKIVEAMVTGTPDRRAVRQGLGAQP